MKNCPVCKRSCSDQATACPRCGWDFTEDFLTHPSVTAPQEKEIQELEQKLKRARSQWNRGHSALHRNWFAALLRLAAALLALQLYARTGLSDRLALLAVCFGIPVGATILWKTDRSPLLRIGAHDILPLMAMFWGLMLSGDGATLSGLKTRYATGFWLLLLAAAVVELLYVALNYVFVPRPKQTRGGAASAARDGETAGWNVAQILLGGLGWGIALGTAVSILFHGLPQPVLALASMPGSSGDPVVFESEAAGRAIRRSVGLEEDGELSGSAAALFDTLTLDLEGGSLSAAELSAFENVTSLSVSNGSAGTLQALSQTLPRLRCLSAENTPAASLSFLSEQKLQALCLTNTSTRDLSALAQQTDLQTLLVADCSLVTDLAPLSGLKELQQLILRRCGVKDLTPLAALERLETLELSGCPVGDTGPLESLKEKGRLRQIIGLADPAA